MSPGKLASQAGHAYTNSILNSSQDLISEYQGPDGIGTKICLRARNLNHILRAHEEALEAGLPCSLITDQGHIMPPFFDGDPIITALGIGPATRSDIQHITGRFNCVA